VDTEGVWQEDFEDDCDRQWSKFARALDIDPEQALRYSWHGRELWPQPERPAPVTCPLCSAPRVFECQLMPPLLRALNVDALSLAVFCCSDSCPPAATLDGLELAQEVSLAASAAVLKTLILT
jgi:pre-rRNA-processing protein TSR4